jgi:hypothetical protein
MVEDCCGYGVTAVLCKKWNEYLNDTQSFEID